ncbi:hypothetical protein CORT_0F00100 [Candida orthopsilosis Co 90-125]|uniref:Uncharacterized protein n=1 Tax=Candida orthopsilosis (strain 90-125) TaxID=1136231 RepID=H8X8U2_CANO9|nr:hypothetical protein CORT_0F00100 [Candida orthopsilosis Co 90-125]CCG24240.1 hypothetical protein CORT_0F00100 [Candida orthopsilosis Co 90-125]
MGGNDLSSLQKLPPTLKQLTLSGRGYFKCGEIFSKIPIGLNYLHLSNCDAMRYADTDFSKFKNLKLLKLSGCGIDNSIVNNIQFPDSLEKLNLSDNTIESIDKVKFPQGIVSLCLGCNRLNLIEGHKFPQTLKKLDVSGNKIKSARLLRNELDEELKIESLFLASDSHGLSCCELPTRVQTLLLDQFKPFNGQRIGDNLVSSSIMDCDNFHYINFGAQSKLRYLSMHNCDLEGFNKSSLSRLEEIELSFMSKVPQGLGHLKKLRYFMLTKSPIEHAVINFYSDSLEVLDLSSNRIENVQLTFPDGNTNLKRLDLGGNCLQDISLEDIGHTSKSKYSDLCELGLYDNRELSNDRITVLIQQLIIMTKCLWTNETVKIFYNRYVNNHLIRNTIK